MLMSRGEAKKKKMFLHEIIVTKRTQIKDKIGKKIRLYPETRKNRNFPQK